jgi:hypothetical protein
VAILVPIGNPSKFRFQNSLHLLASKRLEPHRFYSAHLFAPNGNLRRSSYPNTGPFKLERVTIGLLALQGDYDAQRRVLLKLGADVRLVRAPRDWRRLDGLVIPRREAP